METWLTVAVLLPSRVAIESAASRAAFEPPAAATAAAAAPSAESAMGSGLVAMGKKATIDDEFAALTGLGKGKGKGGGGGGKGGKSGPTSAGGVAADASEAAQGSRAATLAQDALAAAGTPADALAPDRPIAVGYFQRFVLGGVGASGLPAQQQRSAGIVQVRGKAVARVTGLVIGRGAPAAPVPTASSTGAGGSGQRSGGRAAGGGGGGGGAPAAASGDPALVTAIVAGLAKTKPGAGGAAALHALASQLLLTLVSLRADVTPGGDDGDPRASTSTALSPETVALGHTLGSLVLRLPAIQPQRDLRPPVSDMDVIDAFGRSAQLEAAQQQVKCSGCGRWPLQWGLFSRVQQLDSALAAVRKKYSIEALALYPEMQSRLGLLRDLGYTQLGDPGPASGGSPGAAEAAAALDVVKLKGRVAAEVNTCDELM